MQQAITRRFRFGAHQHLCHSQRIRYRIKPYPKFLINPLKPVASISTGSQYTIKAFVNESDIAQIFEGQKAVFSTSAYPDREYSAYVTKIYPTARTSVSLSSQETGVDVELFGGKPRRIFKSGLYGKSKVITIHCMRYWWCRLNMFCRMRKTRNIFML